MINLIRGEFYKLKKSKCFIGMMFLWALLGIIFSYCMIRDANKFNEVAKTICGIKGAVNFLQTQIIINFLFAAFAGVFIAKDLEQNTISRTFTYGYSRNKVILSKIIVYVLYSLFMELVTAVIIGIVFSVMYGFNNITKIIALLYLVRVIFISMFCSTATALITAAVSVISKSIIVTLVSAVVMFIPIFLGDVSVQLGKFIDCILPYRNVMWGIAPFASRNEIIIAAVSSLLVAAAAISIITKHLSKLDIK